MGRRRGAQNIQRALLIGINIYQPIETTDGKNSPAIKTSRDKFSNLDGCVNDVEEMRALLIARFGFHDKNILVLTNQLATRAAIISQIQKHLFSNAQSGDVAFFFYAGHGSQIVNSKSDEPDKRDETIVPADSRQGAADIRDKELRRLFNAGLDRGVSLTAIFDSCHSGSTTRGLPAPGKSRHVQPILQDIADATNYGLALEERDALILSAAQDDQSADEQTLENVSHGAFSAALLSVLRADSGNRSAAEIFLGAKSILQSNGRGQEPVLSGNAERRKANLFGWQLDTSNRLAIAAVRIENGNVILQGGQATGLNIGCQLKQIFPATNRTAALIEITRLNGLTAAQAKILEGDASAIHAGDLFQVTRWTTPPQALLRVWLPASLPAAQCEAALAVAEELRRSAKLEWIDDPTKISPTHVLSWDGMHWILTADNLSIAQFAAPLTVEKVLQALPKDEARARLFFSFPPSHELKTELKIGNDTTNDAIETVAAPADAHYLFTGVVRDGQAHYAWVLPNAQETQTGNQPLPVRTDWFGSQTINNSPAKIARDLEQAASRLGRVKAWLTLQSPGDDGRFPYRLILKNKSTGEIIGGNELRETAGNAPGGKVLPTASVVKNGENLALVLSAEAGALQEKIEPRFIYVFILDGNGRSQLLWPANGQGNSQRLPPLSENPPEEIPLDSTISVGPPFGVDTYILLTSGTAIPDATVLTFDGVRSGGTRGSSSPLQNLLKGVGAATRGVARETPVDWSIQRISVRSVAK